MTASFSYNEQELLSQLKTGDKIAFTKIYELYSAKLYTNLLRLLKAESAAEEMLQDIFVLIWEKRETIIIQQNFNAYLFRIAENKVCDFFRKLKLDRNLRNYIKSISVIDYTYIEEKLFTKEAASIFQQAIDRLPPQRKQVFRLCKIEGKSYHEVSSMLGISTSTINDHIVKATRAVKAVVIAGNEISPMLCIFLYCSVPL